MLAITVDLLQPTIRAGAFDDLALTGRGDEGEWPPSPARLFSALVAGGGTGARRECGDDSELLALEGSFPPRILADRASVVLRSEQVERYVVVDERVAGSVQEYPGRKATLVRPSTRLSPRTRSIIYVWDDLELSDAQLEALAWRAARVGYLGCADSPVRVRVSPGAPDGEAERWWRPSNDGDAFLPVPFHGLLEALDDAFSRFSNGEPVRRSWLPSNLARYAEPGSQGPIDRAGPVVLWLRLEDSLPGRHVLRFTETLKAAVLERYERDGAASAEVPPVLHGHHQDGLRGYDHASFVALLDCGHRHARGRVHGAAILLPPDTAKDVVEAVRAVLFKLRTLVLPGGRALRLRPYGGEPRPLAASPARWNTPAKRFVSVTPIVHERRQRGGPDLAEVTRWCAHAGLPAPRSFRTSPVPLLPGALSLRPSEVFHSTASRRPYSHLELHFDQPIPGPIVLGRMRHLGIGLMTPLPEREGEPS